MLCTAKVLGLYSLHIDNDYCAADILDGLGSGRRDAILLLLNVFNIAFDIELSKAVHWWKLVSSTYLKSFIYYAQELVH